MKTAHQIGHELAVTEIKMMAYTHDNIKPYLEAGINQVRLELMNKSRQCGKDLLKGRSAAFEEKLKELEEVR